MNTGQILLALGALTLLSLTTLLVNRTLLEHEQASIEGPFQLVAISLAQELIEEAIEEAFDEAVLQGGQPMSFPESFTPNESLGPDLEPDGLESYANFDDIDDFHGYTRMDTTDAGMAYTVESQVEYVSANPEQLEPDVLATSPTFHKRLTVTVSSPYLSNDVVLYYLASYQSY